MLEAIKKFHLLLTAEHWRRYILLQTIFMLTALIQVAGAASLAPFIALLSNPSTIHSNHLTQFAYGFLGCSSDSQFLMFFATGVMTLIILSNAIAALSIWMMFSFSFRLGAEFQVMAYRSFITKDFTFYARKNSSQLINVLTQEIPRFIFMFMQPFFSLCAQLLIATIILGGLIYVDIQLASIAALIIGGGYFFVFKLLRERLAAHGHNLWDANNQRLKLLSESLGGIKEIRLLGNEQIYEQRLSDVNNSNLKSQSMIGLSAELPKYIIESISFCALLGLALFLLASYGNSPKVISIMSLYALAGYKLLPAAQTIYKSVAQMKANGSAITEFFEDVKSGRVATLTDNSKLAPLPAGDRIEISALSYAYPEAETHALKNVNLTIPSRSIISLVGFSGAGKSTLADIILGMLHPTQGTIFWGTTEINKSNVSRWQKNLGYVPQSIFIIDDTIKANIAFGVPAHQIDMENVRRAARMANIDHFIESLNDGYEYRVGERGAMLSGGQRQRIGIARALYHDADILIFDEATSALDSVTESEIIATINELRATKTIIMIAHRLATVKISDTIIVLNGGAIEETGSFSELCKRSEKFREMLHLDANGEIDSATALS